MRGAFAEVIKKRAEIPDSISALYYFYFGYIKFLTLSRQSSAPRK